MQKSGKILLVSQHYPPDDTTTATYIGAIAQAVAAETKVVVLSGSPHSRSAATANPEVVATYWKGYSATLSGLIPTPVATQVIVQVPA